MPFLKLINGSIYYEIQGQGSPLVFIHGAWSSHHWWKYQVSAFARNYQVLTYDLRGHGQSHSHINNYDIPFLAIDLKILLQNIGLDETVLIGWSLGGMISIELYLQHPQMIKALVLISTRAQHQPIWKRKTWLSYLYARLNLMINLSAPRKYNIQEASFPQEKALMEAEMGKMSSAAINPEVWEWIKSDFKNFSVKNYWPIAQSLGHWEVSKEILKTIHIPTLILAGEKDQITTPSSAESLHQAIPNSHLTLIKEAGHLLPLEQPQLVNNYIGEFLKSINYF